MINETQLDNLLDRLGQAVTPGENLSERVLARITAEPEARSGVRRLVMSNTYKRAGLGFIAVAAAACIIVAVTLVSRPGPAYALSQTVTAFDGIHYVSAAIYDSGGEKIGNTWVQLDAAGRQKKFRQEGALGDLDVLIVDDGQTAWAHFRNENTVILSASGKYEWIGDFGQFFRQLQGRPDSVVIEQDVEYKGRPAVLVRWLEGNQDIYIDPDTGLPLAIGGFELSYEPIDSAVFELPDAPEGVTVVDERAGAVNAESKPAWMQQQEDFATAFDRGRQALAAGDHERAIGFLGQAMAADPRRDWAHFYLGQAYFAAGQYAQAIERYTHVIDLFGTIKMVAPYAHLARGKAYRLLGKENSARADLAVALDHMVLLLRNPKGAMQFDYADDAMYREAKRNGTAPTEAESVWLMIQRLRDITGENFGYAPAAPADQREEAIAAWEQWWRDHQAEYAGL